MDDEEQAEEGAPPWMATFADLMSLLVCFFVLLLSFSEMDVIKYRTIAGSLKEAFGVQSKIEAQSIPKGTSVIAREFSPGTPQPIAQPIINQRTTDDSRRNLQVGNPETEDALREILRQGITDGKLDIDSSSDHVTIRIREKGSFSSGQAVLDADLLPVVAQLRVALKEIAGTISVEGHTDNVPIMSPEFDSNWDLSASRALSVATELMRGDELEETRFQVVGHSDNRPLKPNDTVENRAANRRVEIVIRKQLGEEEDPVVSALSLSAVPQSGVEGEQYLAKGTSPP